MGAGAVTVTCISAHTFCCVSTSLITGKGYYVLLTITLLGMSTDQSHVTTIAGMHLHQHYYQNTYGLQSSCRSRQCLQGLRRCQRCSRCLQ